MLHIVLYGIQPKTQFIIAQISQLIKEQYKQLQKPGSFDTKTSTWLQTPSDFRKRGSAIFGDFSYTHVFMFHYGTQSYYGASLNISH